MLWRPLTDHSQALALEDGCESAVWVDPQGFACHIMSKQKNRPRGSLLRRPCTCSEVPTLCLPCRLSKVLHKKKKGERLYSLTPHEFTKRMKLALAETGSEDVTSFTLKAFRAGHATELAKLGVALAKIMEKGEWSSRAIFSYINMELVDEDLLLHTITERDED